MTELATQLVSCIHVPDDVLGRGARVAESFVGSQAVQAAAELDQSRLVPERAELARQDLADMIEIGADGSNEREEQLGTLDRDGCLQARFVLRAIRVRLGHRHARRMVR